MLDTFRKIFFLLDRGDKIKLFLLLFLTLLMGLVQAGSVASILPLIAVLSQPQIIDDNRLLSGLYAYLDFSSKENFTKFIGFAVFGYFLFAQAFKAFTTYFQTRFTEMRSYNLTMRLFRGYLNQPYVWFLHRHSSDLGKSVLNEVRQVLRRALMPFVSLLSNVTVALCIVAVVIAVEPISAIIGATFIAGSYTLVYLSMRQRLEELGAQGIAANKLKFRLAQEALGGIKDIKLTGLEHSYATRFATAVRLNAATAAEASIMRVMPRFALETLAFGGMIGFVLILLVGNPGALTEVLPVLGVYAFAAVRLFPAVQTIFGNVSTLKNAQKVLNLIHADFAATSGHDVHDRDKVDALPLRRGLQLRDIEYSYPYAERAALCGLDMTVKANTTVGIVGSTGAGKTTLVDIVLGLLEPDSGTLLVDDTVVDASNVRSWQKSIGYVPQQIFLVDDTVSANIAFGVPAERINHAAVEAAARIAELHDFVVDDLPEGYETRVGERGVRLSGGQRQRIGIARALYHDPDMLILDEATSALDNLTEKAVMDAVHNLGARKTVIMIAHRLSTVKPCDEIFMLEQGRVVAKGTYQELMERSEAFRAMANVA